MNTTTTTLPPALESGIRLDKYLVGELPDLSRERIKALIKDGAVTVNDEIMKSPSQKIQLDDVVAISIPETKPLEVGAENIPLEILYEDDDLLVINKQAGLTVHPAPGQWSGTLVNALIHHCGDSLSGINGVARPGIVHRLDKDTSGTMVVAKHDVAHRHLAKQFEERTLSRFYNALCYGVPNPEIGIIEGNIGRNPKHRKKMAVVDVGGKPATTEYKILKRFQTDAALIQAKLHTGRTHQIRVHMAYCNFPLIGDPLYTRVRKLKHYSDDVNHHIRGLTGQMLHAAHIGFVHPVTKEELSFETPVPQEFQDVLDMLSV